MTILMIKSVDEKAPIQFEALREDSIGVRITPFIALCCEDLKS
jgi:hypothetical protein